MKIKRYATNCRPIAALISVLTISLLLISIGSVIPINASGDYYYFSEDAGEANTSVQWGFPYRLIGSYTQHTLRLSVVAIDLAAGTASGSMIVYSYATSTGWVNGTIRWYMLGQLFNPFLGIPPVLGGVAYVTVTFKAIDLTVGATAEKVLMHVHADPITSTYFEREYFGWMSIPLYNGHLYSFGLYVEVHAEALGVLKTVYSDFAGQEYPYSRIEWRFVDVPNTDPYGGDDGGCPYLYVYNGVESIADNNILPTAEVSKGTEVDDYYKLEQTPIPNYQSPAFSLYSLQIHEFENEHSYIDQVALLAIDHSPTVNIAVTPNGEILTYGQPNLPIFCFDNYGNNRLGEISQMNGNLTDSTTYFYGNTGDYLLLNFGQINSENAKLILRDDMKCQNPDIGCCIQVQVKNITDEWQNVVMLAPRNYWSIQAVNLSAYIVPNHDLVVRLLWTLPHRLDYVGLDVTSPDNYELKHGYLISATHSTQGNVRSQLLIDDDNFTELIPYQQISLKFLLSNKKPQDKRTFIFFTKGYYNSI